LKVYSHKTPSYSYLSIQVNLAQGWVDGRRMVVSMNELKGKSHPKINSWEVKTGLFQCRTTRSE
jgi:hypothetical protein